MNAIIVDQKIKSVTSLLRLTYGIVPIVAGIDKFTNLLTDWTHYLNPAIAEMLPVSPYVFMMIVGGIEIVAGIIVLFRPAIGGIIVAGWLTLIALSLIINGSFLDVAVRDLSMAIGAFSLSRLVRAHSVATEETSRTTYLFNTSNQTRKQSVR